MIEGSGIVAGFGFRAGAGVASLRAALALAQEGHPPVDVLATAADKADQLRSFADTLGLPLVAVDAQALEEAETVTLSLASLAARRTGSVAEGAAMAAAGPGARLLTTRHISPDRMATCAIAQSISVIIPLEGGSSGNDDQTTYPGA